VQDPERVVERVLPRLRPGAIIILHQGLDHSLRVLDRVIDAVEKQGYAFVIPEEGQLRAA
jgi:peptidoglycan/xylan/chitin deacetylase (PgdA/CDA1 family)